MGEDGVYYVCKDKATWPYPDQTKQKCLVYSFGISWDFKFDDAIANMGCEVHAFDPCMIFNLFFACNNCFLKKNGF